MNHDHRDSPLVIELRKITINPPVITKGDIAPTLKASSRAIMAGWPEIKMLYETAVEDILFVWFLT